MKTVIFLFGVGVVVAGVILIKRKSKYDKMFNTTKVDCEKNKGIWYPYFVYTGKGKNGGECKF